MSSLSHDPFAILFLLAVTIVMPVLGVRDYRKMLRGLREGRTSARIEAYRGTIAVQWALTLGFLGWWLLAGRELTPLGLIPSATGWQWLAVGAGIAIIGFLLFQMLTVLRSPEQLDKIRRQARELCGIAPLTSVERRVFALVSATAGICEEILFRGLLITVLAAVMGTWPAIILSSIIFGLGHAYQGWKGIGKIALAGLVLALLFVGSGSLFIPMLLHAVGDLTGGYILGAASRVAPVEASS